GIRENETAVYQDHIPLALIQRDILSHFAEAPQRADVHRDRRLHLIIAGRLRLAAAARRAGCRRTVLPRLTAGMPRAGRCVLRIPTGAAFRSGLPRHPAAGLAGLLLRIFLSARRTACSRG